MEQKICSATKRRIENDRGAVEFPCPACGERKIIRSTFARVNAIKYICECGFMGPN